MPSKHHILMSAITFSTNGLWEQDFTKNWACDHFVENTAPSKMAPNIIAILNYSKSFKWIREVIRTRGKCINHIRIFEKILWLSKISLNRRATFESHLNCPYKIVVVWDDQTIGNMDPCHQSNSNITEKSSFLHNVTRVLVTLRRSKTFMQTTINLGLETLSQPWWDCKTPR